MTGMPESNAESVCAKRAELFDLIKSISAKLEILHSAKKEFDEKGVIPEVDAVFPPEGNEQAEPDLASLDEAALKKQKKNLQSSNSKDQTILDYQSKERTEVKIPMPNGPKRSRIEMRISDRNKKIVEIDTLLLKLMDFNSSTLIFKCLLSFLSYCAQALFKSSNSMILIFNCY